MFFCRKKPKRSNRIFVRDMVVEMAIGAYDDEKGRTQRVCINVEVEPKIWPKLAHDNLDETFSYDTIVKHIVTVTQGEHIQLVETVAEKIAAACLAEKTIRNIRVRVEKLDIYPFAVPGVEIIRVK